MKQLTVNEVETARKETCNLPTQNEETFWLQEPYKTDFQSKSRFNAPNTSYLMKIDIWIFNATLKPLQARAQYDLLTSLHVSKWCTSQTSKPKNFFFFFFISSEHFLQVQLTVKQDWGGHTKQRCKTEEYKA